MLRNGAGMKAEQRVKVYEREREWRMELHVEQVSSEVCYRADKDAVWSQSSLSHADHTDPSSGAKGHMPQI